jgi:hypothetical protein
MAIRDQDHEAVKWEHEVGAEGSRTHAACEPELLIEASLFCSLIGIKERRPLVG